MDYIIDQFKQDLRDYSDEIEQDALFLHDLIYSYVIEYTQYSDLSEVLYMHAKSLNN